MGKREEAVDAVETLLRDFVNRDDEAVMAMPAIEDWCLVATFYDVADDENGKWIYFRGANQSTHRTIGLLTMQLDQLRAITKDDD